MDVGGKWLLHADGRATAPDVAGEGQEFLHGDEVALLVARGFGCQLEIHLVLSGNDTDEIAALVAMQYQGLEDASDVFTQAGSYMSGAEVALIHFVGNQFIVYTSLVHQAGHIGFLDILHCRIFILILP